MIDDEQARILAARWLRWVNSIPSERSPLGDQTGQYAGENQPDDVWFLAGNRGGGAKRQCAVPAGRPLFFPLFNMWGRSKDLISPQAGGQAALDGERLPTWTVHNTESIKIPLIAGKSFPQWKVRMWGLWSYHPGLPVGDHVLEFHGFQQPNRFWVELFYDLTCA
jgi:hypothetical protein